jgi:hypothetical protein
VPPLGTHTDGKHILSMAKSVVGIRFEVRPMKAEHKWVVVATFPDTPQVQLGDFATEADAKNWITNYSSGWLKKLGYADD